ncbi:hypothetical protein GCM10011351_00440 [Paraliobacillus quinghaiensis]|uniref:Antigen I/II N-terminal domain-containing protein n=1 Tax=Paraliobacillus quinghaiensis TaxID=470815 RepID=A0A917TDU3_9BACI|nr:hypothetical protein [Paraliobacillus quinghaiensis]GGM18571.1 hypothetical protein GCM10011351_00440 [Paraliobacillus quinghaiensis]
MKKFFVTLFVLAIVPLFLVACSTNEQENETTEDQSEKDGTDESTENTMEENTENDSVDVDKGLLSVEVTLPASMFEEEEVETLEADAEKEGMEVKRNDNGSFTYKMSKSKHNEMMEQIETTLTQTVNEMKNDEGFPSIKDITHNNSFTEFTLLVDREAFENSMDVFAAFSLGLSSMIYQLYDGADLDNSKATIFVKDEATGEVFDEIIYPDDMGE